MDNKYYTPELEEFCIGFEYEEYQQKEWNKLISPPKSLGYEWVKKVFDTSTSLGKIKHNVEGMNWMIDGVDKGHPTCKIKVKYLDKEDIESLGFTCKVWNNLSGYFCRGEYTLGLHSKETDSKLFMFCTISQNDDGNNIIRFSGKIKNKMELKKLLKQLEIC
jgi:hypothetical protein